MENLEVFYKLMIEYPWCTIFTFLMVITILSFVLSCFGSILEALKEIFTIKIKKMY